MLEQLLRGSGLGQVVRNELINEEVHRLRTFENWVLRRIFGHK
jgi:hypothetical protein